VRVIAGSLRGKILSSIQGDAVRPTSDKIRGAIFSALSSRLGTFQGRRFLDMFAGSGALSIEALSRGAAFAVLVDTSSSSLELVRKNLAACKLTQNFHIVRGNVLAVLDKIRPRGPYDVVFVDPPYGKGLALQALELLSREDLLQDEAWIVVETGREEPLPDALGPLQRSHTRDYGGTTIHYYCFHLAHEGHLND